MECLNIDVYGMRVIIKFLSSTLICVIAIKNMENMFPAIDNDGIDISYEG